MDDDSSAPTRRRKQRAGTCHTHRWTGAHDRGNSYRKIDGLPPGRCFSRTTSRRSTSSSSCSRLLRASDVPQRQHPRYSLAILNWLPVLKPYPVCTENSDSDVLMMQSTDQGMRYDAPDPLNRAKAGASLSRERCDLVVWHKTADCRHPPFGRFLGVNRTWAAALPRSRSVLSIPKQALERPKFRTAVSPLTDPQRSDMLGRNPYC